MVDSSITERTKQDEHAVFCHTRKEGREEGREVMMGLCQRIQKPTERLPNGQNCKFEQQNKVVSDYNPKYKIDIHEAILR